MIAVVTKIGISILVIVEVIVLRGSHYINYYMPSMVNKIRL